MQSSAFNLATEMKLREVTYSLTQKLWIRHDLSDFDFSFTNWQSFKYLNDAGDALSNEVQSLPNNAGGLYMFHINCPVIPGMTSFPAYIGRAQLTEGQNLRKRCKEYFQKFARSDERPKITRMFEYWRNELYLSFIVLDENEKIIGFEKRLINALLLPFNDEIPDIEIRQAVKAFN